MIEENKTRKYVPHIRNRIEEIEERLVQLEKLSHNKSEKTDDVDYVKSIQVIYGLINDANHALESHITRDKNDMDHLNAAYDSLRHSLKRNLDRIDSTVNYLSMLIFVLVVVLGYTLFIR